MALTAGRCGGGKTALSVAALLRRRAVECPRLRVSGCGSVIQVATMKATYGEKYPYEKPFPYETKKYGLLQCYYEKTIPRLNENSKIIVVEGNIGVGKTAFAKKLAAEFDLKFFDATPDSKCFIHKEYGFDMRGMDVVLPASLKTYDLANFYADKHPEKGYVGRLNLQWYQEKFLDYMLALKHLLSTGQGVVLVRSVYSDMVFIEACKQLNWVSPNFVKYYYELRDSSICELFKPHLTIFLDAPIEVLRQRIKARNDPKEVNSKVLSDEYLTTIQNVFRQKFLPLMRKCGEVVEIDWSEVANETDMDMIVEEVQLLKLESEDRDEAKFEDWSRNVEDDYMFMRRFLDHDQSFYALMMKEPPLDCPELLAAPEDAHFMSRLYTEHPVYRYRPGWAPVLGNSTAFKF